MFHPIGRKTIFGAFALLALPYAIMLFIEAPELLHQIYLGVAILLYVLVLQFFRNPKRNTQSGPLDIVAPVDGRIVISEIVEEPEYFKGKRQMISIFMSPLNVHVVRAAIAGTVVYGKYHPGKFLVAWHPKSSTLNERTTSVIETPHGRIMMRMIAGAVARRIHLFAKPGRVVRAGQDFGFIQFGSRVDVYLPLDAEITCNIGDKPCGGETIIAKLAE